MVRLVEGGDEQQRRRHHGDDRAHEKALHHHALTAVGEEEHEHEDHGGDEEEHDPERRRDHTLGAVDPVVACLLAVGGLVEPLVVGRLLRRGRRPHRLQRPEEHHSPGADLVAQRPVLHPRPRRTGGGASVGRGAQQQASKRVHQVIVSGGAGPVEPP